MEKGEKYLPVGTVVMLTGGSKRAMITGFCAMGEGDQKVYDYSGCLYPEGFLSSNQVCLFDHEQIAQVFHMGLVDAEETEFKNKLKAVIPQMMANQGQGTPVGGTTPPVAPAVEIPAVVPAPQDPNQTGQ